MPSRLNPRDYDLGELRDAVRETSRLRHNDQAVGGRDAGGRTDSRPVERTADAEQQPDCTADRSGGRQYGSDEVSEEDCSNRSSLTEPRADARQSSEDNPGPSRSKGGQFGRYGPAATRQDTNVREERSRRTMAGITRSRSRDRTAHGEPRRRGRSEERVGARRRPNTQFEGHDIGQRLCNHSTETFEFHSDHSDVERPYLSRLPDSYDAQVEIFEWLAWLLETCGRESTLEALAYYESVEWLSEDSRESLKAFVEGLTATELPEPRPLNVDHHRESLRYVMRLARRTGR